MPSLLKRTYKNADGNFKFFLMNLSHETAMNHYKTNFALMQYHKYSLEDLDNMIPFEREIYIFMLKQHLEEEKQRLQSS